MLFDLGWSEILLIGVVALVFIGPKDLPKAMRVAGYWIRKARTLSREFQGSIDQMLREAELDDVRQQLKKAAEFDLDREFHNTIDPTGSLSESLKPPELPNFSAAAEQTSPLVEGRAPTAVGTTPGASAALQPAAGAAAPPAAAESGAAAPAEVVPAPVAKPRAADDPAAMAGEIMPPRP